jgi:hypothetical protein
MLRQLFSDGRMEPRSGQLFSDVRVELWQMQLFSDGKVERCSGNYLVTVGWNCAQATI